jgi:hypothetical protein
VVYRRRAPAGKNNLIERGAIQVKYSSFLTSQTGQFLVFLGLSAAILLLAVLAHRLDAAAFPRFFGRLHPLLVVALVSLLGLGSFAFLLLAGFAVYRAGNLGGIFLALALAVPFAALMILVDRRWPFPLDINVAPPAGYAFYPVIGFVVEVLFHLLPFAVLFWVLGLFPGITAGLRLGLSVGLAALVEPLFQGIFGAGHNIPPVLAFMFLFLFVFNLVQLRLFVRYDFASMYTLRLGYYLLWHLLWGQVRLKVLF